MRNRLKVLLCTEYCYELWLNYELTGVNERAHSPHRATWLPAMHRHYAGRVTSEEGTGLGCISRSGLGGILQHRHIRKILKNASLILLCNSALCPFCLHVLMLNLVLPSIWGYWHWQHFHKHGSMKNTFYEIKNTSWEPGAHFNKRAILEVYFLLARSTFHVLVKCSKNTGHMVVLMRWFSQGPARDPCSTQKV